MKESKIVSKPLPRGRNGGRKPKISANRKPTQANFYVPAEELAAFCELVPSATDRNQLISKWVRAYTISNGESDRLFAQSPALLKVIAYLEAQSEPPEDLLDECQSLLVSRDSNGDEPENLIV